MPEPNGNYLPGREARTQGALSDRDSNLIRTSGYVQKPTGWKPIGKTKSHRTS